MVLRPSTVPTGAIRALLVLALFLASGAADAHQQSLSFGELRVHGAQVEGRLRFSAADLLPLLHRPASDAAVKLTQRDLDAAGAALSGATVGELRLRSAGADCTASPGSATLEAEDGVLIAALWTCPGPVDDLEVRVGFLELISPGHTHLAKIVFDDGGPGEVAQRIAQQGAETFAVTRARSTRSTALRFLRLGVLHIFTGFDHIAFLVGLLLLGGSFRTLVKIVTSFTLAHSITLALAALDLVVPPPRLIEPLIAASIVFVAAENLWALRAGGGEAGGRAAHAASTLRHRWMLTFAFGLVHGFGFASALRELHLPRAGLAASLVTFNLGVEAGQLCIVAAILPLLGLLRRQRWFSPAGVRLLSGAVGAAGLFWLLQRLAT
ncbi:MAG: HupE/UreJ family protein [Myxococcales bacterium]